MEWYCWDDFVKQYKLGSKERFWLGVLYNFNDNWEEDIQDDNFILTKVLYGHDVILIELNNKIIAYRGSKTRGHDGEINERDLQKEIYAYVSRYCKHEEGTYILEGSKAKKECEKCVPEAIKFAFGKVSGYESKPQYNKFLLDVVKILQTKSSVSVYNIETCVAEAYNSFLNEIMGTIKITAHGVQVEERDLSDIVGYKDRIISLLESLYMVHDYKLSGRELVKIISKVK